MTDIRGSRTSSRMGGRRGLVIDETAQTIGGIWAVLERGGVWAWFGVSA